MCLFWFELDSLMMEFIIKLMTVVLIRGIFRKETVILILIVFISANHQLPANICTSNKSQRVGVAS